GCATLRPTGILLVSGVFSLRGQAPSGRMCSQGITRPPPLRQRCDWRPRPGRSRAAPATASGCPWYCRHFGALPGANSALRPWRGRSVPNRDRDAWAPAVAVGAVVREGSAVAIVGRRPIADDTRPVGVFVRAI